MNAQSDLIFDIGVNKGEDTAFYLAKGFRVIGVEANPTIYEALTDQFREPLLTGQLVLLNKGVWSEASTLKFYSNLDNDHWSSFDPEYGCRQGTRFETLDIECLTITDLLDTYGTPRYMKIDVEGADKKIIECLEAAGIRPTYLSIEEYGIEAIDALHAVGYDRFQFVPQRNKSRAIPPNPPREGTFVARTFTGYDSGLFGRELSDRWLNYDQARLAFERTVRDARGEFVGPEHEWFDIHATMAGEVKQSAIVKSNWLTQAKCWVETVASNTKRKLSRAA